jgi:hypothetical protein
VDKNVPVGLVVIKEPSSMVTSHSAVLDSLYEDMVYFRCLYGVKELFAIVTTYDEWNICWLSDCSAFATSDEEHPPVLPEGFALGIFNKVLLMKNSQVSVANDSLRGTGTLRYTDARLVPMLVTVIRKMFHATVYPPCVSPGSCNRLCIKVTAREAWECALLPERLRTLSLMPARAVERMRPRVDMVEYEQLGSEGSEGVSTSEECFYLLRDYHGGRDGRVWQACDSRGHLAVIKFTIDPDTIQLECDHWNEIFGDIYDNDDEEDEGADGTDDPSSAKESASVRPLVYITQLAGISALVMPVAFHCVESVLDSRQLFFDVALHNWAFELGTKRQTVKTKDTGRVPLPVYASTDQADVQCVVGLRECLELVADQNGTGAYTPHTVAIAAIEYIARCHYIHEDIEYRHVALLPVVREERGGIQVKLLPILIDLSQMTANVKYKVARQSMIEKLDAIQFDRDGVRA